MVEIPLNRRDVALIDECDLPIIRNYKWSLLRSKNHSTSYAVARSFGWLYMHRLIMNAPKGSYVDHANHNGLDNRRKNLRLCSPSENNRNNRGWAVRASQFKGVYKAKNGKWEARLCWESKQRYIGTFKTQEEAAKAYDSYAKTYHGKYAVLNFQEGQ